MQDASWRACFMFLLEVDDSLNSINFIDSTAKQLSKIGGGVAINLSKLRAW